MEKYLNDLTQALLKVEKEKYIDVIGINTNDNLYQQNAENAFTAELFHQFRVIMEMTENRNYYRNLVLHFDINKERLRGRPDIVLHFAQNNQDDQRMYVEVKTTPSPNLNEDLRKLFYAVATGNSGLNYCSGVLIVGRSNYITTVTNIKNYLQTNRKSGSPLLKKLFLFHFTSDIIPAYTFQSFTTL